MTILTAVTAGGIAAIIGGIILRLLLTWEKHIASSKVARNLQPPPDIEQIRSKVEALEVRFTRVVEEVNERAESAARSLRRVRATEARMVDRDDPGEEQESLQFEVPTEEPPNHQVPETVAEQVRREYAMRVLRKGI